VDAAARGHPGAGRAPHRSGRARPVAQELGRTRRLAEGAEDHLHHQAGTGRVGAAAAQPAGEAGRAEGRRVHRGAVAVRRGGADPRLERLRAQVAGRRETRHRAVPVQPGPPRGDHEPAEDPARRRQGGIPRPLRRAGSRRRRACGDARPGDAAASVAVPAASQNAPAQK
jgi:hypothetical protein